MARQHLRIAAFAFLGGILLVQQLPELPPPAALLALLPAVAVVLRYPRFLVIVFFLGGAAWTVFRAGLILQEPLARDLEGRDLVVDGVIADIPQPGDYGVRFQVDVVGARLDGQPVRIPGRVLLSHGDTHFSPRVGEQWRMTVRLRRPHGLQNPGGFDYEGYLFRQRIRARGYVRDDPPAQREGEARGPRYDIGRWRQTLGERLRAQLPDNPYSGLIVALANGDTRGITDSQWEVLRRTGTLHLVAISGLHISLVAGIVFVLARFCWALPGFTVLRLPAPIFGAAAGFLAACAYAALAGFVVPTQRALVMLAVALGAVALRRRWPPSQLLAAALLAVLVYDPFAVMASGFWLSFGAVAVIVFALRGQRSPEPLWRKWGQVQGAVALGMLPLLLWLFQQVSLSAPVANLLAVPVFDLLAVPLTLASALLLGLGLDALAALLLHTAAVLLDGLWWVLDHLAAIPATFWTQHQPATWTVGCALVGVLLLLAPRGWPVRALGVVWLLPLFLVRPAGPGAGEVWFTLLDVGQGLATVVRTQTHTLVFDTGARFSPHYDIGAAVVLPYLRAMGIRRLDALIVSHGDNDHIGGAASIAATLPIDRVLTGAPGFSGEPCREGQTWRWDEVAFTVLGPNDVEAGRHNDGSCVVRIDSRYGSVLLPGDIEKRAERRLLAAGAPLRADVLVAPHHGSRTSSTEEFVAAVAPRHVLFPVGYRNRYRHPNAQVVGRYQAIGARLYDSPSAGALEFRFGPTGLVASAYREHHRRYWFDVEPAP